MTSLSRQPQLARPNAAPIFDSGAAQNYAKQMSLALGMLRDYIAADDPPGARIWAESLDGAARRVGTWVYRAANPNALSIWSGADGWAKRLLTLEVELVEKGNAAARKAHSILRPLFEEIARREMPEAYDAEAA